MQLYIYIYTYVIYIYIFIYLILSYLIHPYLMLGLRDLISFSFHCLSVYSILLWYSTVSKCLICCCLTLMKENKIGIVSCWSFQEMKYVVHADYGPHCSLFCCRSFFSIHLSMQLSSHTSICKSMQFYCLLMLFILFALILPFHIVASTITYLLYPFEERDESVDMIEHLRRIFACNIFP